MTDLVSYPVPGALAAARVRAALAEMNLAEAAAVASAVPPEQLVACLGSQAALRPWGCAVTGGKTQGVVVLAGGLARSYHGAEWQSFMGGAGLDDELVHPRRGWVVTPEGQSQSLGFDNSAAGAVSAAAVLGIMMHLGVDLPTPLGLGGRAIGPDRAELSGKEAWHAFVRVPAMWVAAAELFGVERVLAAVANRADGPPVGPEQVLAALYRGAQIRRPDPEVERWVVASETDGEHGLAVMAAPEAWTVGKANGYVVTRWRCEPFGT